MVERLPEIILRAILQNRGSASEKAIAGRVIAFLEDRRVLYNSYELEIPKACLDSVQEIRAFLTKELGPLKSQNIPIADLLENMRRACRRFIDVVERNGGIVVVDPFIGRQETWNFFVALGELRAQIGLCLEIMATQYNLSIQGDLEKILPPPQKG